MAFTAAAPSQKFATIAAVTAWGQGETPRLSTPWSPAQTRTAGFSGTGGGHSPAIPASRTPSSSNRPRLPGGLVSPRCRSRVSLTRAPIHDLRGPRLVVVAVLVVPRLIRVVVGRCGGAHLFLETWQGDAVDAHVAVHADV